ENRSPQSALRDRKDPEVYQGAASAGKEKIHHYSEQEQNHNRFQAFHDIFKRHPGQVDHTSKKNRGDHIADKPVLYKERHEKQKGADNLHPGVKSVYRALCRIILSDRYSSNHGNSSLSHPQPPGSSSHPSIPEIRVLLNHA